MTLFSTLALFVLLKLAGAAMDNFADRTSANQPAFGLLCGRRPATGTGSFDETKYCGGAAAFCASAVEEISKYSCASATACNYASTHPPTAILNLVFTFGLFEFTHDHVVSNQTRCPNGLGRRGTDSRPRFTLPGEPKGRRFPELLNTTGSATISSPRRPGCNTHNHDMRGIRNRSIPRLRTRPCGTNPSRPRPRWAARTCAALCRVSRTRASFARC